MTSLWIRVSRNRTQSEVRGFGESFEGVHNEKGSEAGEDPLNQILKQK